MTQEFSLDQNRVSILAVVLVVLLFLVFAAGYLSGTIVGLPETQAPPIAKRPAVEPPPKPPVKPIQVPQVVTRPVPEPEEVAEEPEPLEEAPVEKLYSVQVGAFRTAGRAEAQQDSLAAKGYRPYIYHGPNSKGAMWYTVRVGDFDDVEDAILAAREFRALEGASVALTHYDSLMMVRDANGRRIEIAPPELPTARTPAGDQETAETAPVAVAEEPDPVAAEPDPVAAEPEPVATEPEPAAAEPEPVAAEPEPVAVEPEPVAAEPEPVAVEPEPVATEPEPVAEDPAGTAAYRVTFALPEKTPATPETVKDDESKRVAGLIVAAEAKQYSVQVGAFLNGDNAVKFAEKLRGYDYPAYVFRYTDTEGNAWSAVRIGDFENLEAAQAAAEEFEAQREITAIVTKIDAIRMILK